MSAAPRALPQRRTKGSGRPRPASGRGKAAAPVRRSRPASPPKRAPKHTPKHRPTQRVAPQPRRRWLPFLIATFLIVGVLVVGVTSLQAVVSQGSFRMQELTRHNRELQQEYGRLNLKVAQLSSPGRIARKARQMGFRLPNPGEVRALPVQGSAPNTSGGLRNTAFSLKGVLEQGR